MKALTRKPADRLQRLSPLTSVLVGFAFLAVGVTADCVSPLLVSFTLFYVLGTAFLGWTVGFWPATAFALLSCLATAYQDWQVAQNAPGHIWIAILNAGCGLLVFSGVGWLTARLASITRNLNQLVEERTAQLQSEAEQHQTTSERLEQANERFLQVISNITEVFWLCELPDLRVIYASPGYERIWGRPVEDLYRDSKSWLNAVRPEDRDQLSRRILPDQAAGRHDVEYRITRSDGTTRWIRDRAFPVRNSRGEVYRLAGIAEDITDQKRIEEVLKTQAAIVKNMAEGVIVTDQQGLVVQMNPAAEKIWNVQQQDVLGLPVTTFSTSSEDKSADTMRGVLASLQDNGVWRGTFCDRRKDGSLLYRESQMSRVESQGRILNVAVEQDVTERVQADQQLQMQSRVLENMAEAVVMADEKGDIILTNPAADALLGYERGELAGKPLHLIAAMTLDEYANAFERDLREVRSGAAVMREYQARRKDGALAWVEFRASGFSLGSRYLLVLVGQDITERKRAEQVLVRQKELYRTLFDLCPDGILLEDTGGTILDVNDAICEALGYSRTELLGQNIRVFAAPPDAHEIENNLAALRSGESLEHEVWNTCKNGRRRLMRLNERPIAFPDGRRGIMVVASDITERKRHELTKEALLTLGTKLNIARTPVEAAQAVFASADQLWDWHCATLDVYIPEEGQMQHVLNYDIVDGRRREVPAAYETMPPTERMRRIMEGGPELILRKDTTTALPGSTMFGDTSRVSASLMCVPLRRDGRHVGVLSIQSYTHNAYTEDDLRKLQALADHCGTALDRIRAEAASRESEERYRTLAESSPDAIFILDRDVRLQYVNSTAAAHWGRAPRELVGRPLSELFPPETARRQSEVVKSILDTGEIVHRDVEVPFPAERRWQEARLAPMRGPGGAITSVMGISRDITERKRAEAALRESEERFRTLSAATFEGIAVSKHGVIMDCNDQLADMLRCTPAQVIGRRVEEFVPPEQRETALRHLRQRTEGIQEHELLRRDGSRCMVESHGKQLGDETSVRVTALRDITARKHAEEALRRSEERYRTVVEDQTEMITRFKPDGTLTFVNEVFCRLFGTTPEAVIGHKWQPRADAADLPQVEAQLRQLSPTNPVVIIENCVFSKTGERHWMQFANRALFDDQGNILEIQSVGRDMTERKRAEEALRESESKLTAVFRILPVGISIVSHDGKILDMNPALCRSLDVSRDALFRRDDFRWKIFRSDGTMFPPAEVPSQAAIREQREILDVEIGIEKENGAKIWVSVNASPLPGVGAVVSTVDITERKRAEFLLRAQRDLAAGLGATSELKTAAKCLLEIALQIEGMDSGCIFLFDSTTGTLDLMTERGCSSPPTPANGHLPPDSSEALIVAKAKPFYLAHGQLREGRSQFGVGEDVRALAIAPLCHAGIVLGAIKLLSRTQPEISPHTRLVIETIANEAAGAIARIRAEEALHQSEARLRAFITAAPVLLFACDREGRITLEDGLALKALGVEPGARVGKSVFDVFAHTPTLLDNVRRALQGEEFSNMVELGGCAFDCWYSPVRDKSGVVTGLNGVGTNITERYRLERQILEISDREQARIGQDLHDGLCQHLVTLAFDANSLQMELSRRRHSESQRAERIAGFLDAAITEARHLARGLFPVRLESEGLAPALQELANTTCSRFNIQCRFRSRGRVEVRSSAVATHLYRIAQEAVSNAIRHGKSRTIMIYLRDRARELELQVSDDGSGFPPKHPGPSTGMGLHIMDYRARAVGGTLRYASRSEGGVIVSCCIPHAQSQ